MWQFYQTGTHFNSNRKKYPFSLENDWLIFTCLCLKKGGVNTGANWWDCSTQIIIWISVTTLPGALTGLKKVISHSTTGSVSRSLTRCLCVSVLSIAEPLHSEMGVTDLLHLAAGESFRESRKGFLSLFCNEDFQDFHCCSSNNDCQKYFFKG